MKMKCRIPVVLLLLAFFMPTTAFGFGIEAAIGGWYQSPGGQLSYKALTEDDELDLKDDLGYDEETRPFGRVKIDMPLFFPNIYLMYTPMQFEGEGQKSFDFNFGDDVISGNVPFDSKLKADHFDVGLYYGLPFVEEATLDVLNIELGINVRILSLEAEIKQSATGVDESEKGTVPVPMIYLGVQVRPVKWLALEGEGRGLAYSGDAYYSLIGRLRANFWGPLFVTGGYRYDKLKYDDDDLYIDIDFSGPFAEFGVAF